MGAAVVIAGIFVALVSLVREPARRHLMAVLVAGAGATYFHGGLGNWKYAFSVVMLYVAYRGLSSYAFRRGRAAAHGWDAGHRFYGTPIVLLVPTSSGRCAICDALIAI